MEFHDDEGPSPKHSKAVQPGVIERNSSLTSKESPTINSAGGKVGVKTSVRQLLSRHTSGPIFDWRHETEGSSRPWRTTWIRFGPLSGLCAILIAIASLMASLGILVGSNGHPVADWTSPPSTYLATFTAIANISVRYAAIQGVVIAWWFRACNGSTLAKLHWDWRAGATLRGALTAGRRMGLLGLACIFSTLVVVDGPLIQRSSIVVPAPIVNHPVPLNILMAPEIPHGYSGFWSHSGGAYSLDTTFNETAPSNKGGVATSTISYPSNNLTGYVTQSWLVDSPFGKVVHGCPGKCKVKLNAPALFPTECSSHSVEIDPYQEWNAGVQSYAPPLTSDGLIISIMLVVSDENEWINLVTGSSQPKDCLGTLNYDICTLEAGIGEYDVTVDEDGNASLDSAIPKLLALSNNTDVDHSTVSDIIVHPSTLGGVSYLHWQTYTATYSWFPENGSIRTQAYGNVPFGAVAIPDPSTPVCQSFINPQERILQSFNKLMVYSGAHTAREFGTQLNTTQGFPVSYNTTGSLHGSQPVFHSEYSFFIGATIIVIACIAFITPTYWGWWKLGRPVSFSPLEIAKAFESPMFVESNSNSTGRDMARSLDEVEVQYGVKFTPDQSGRKLAFASPAEVTIPRDGNRFEV